MEDGLASKKFLFSIGVVALAFVYALLAASTYDKLEPMFGTFTGFLEVIAGMYLVGNLGNKYLVSKMQPVVEEQETPSKEK